MSSHLPECPNFPCQCADVHGDIAYECICPSLRACEERVREEENRNVIGSVSLAAIGEANLQQYQLGWSEALDAAREAVAGVKKFVEFPGQPVNYIHPDFFIAAIDKLRDSNE